MIINWPFIHVSFCQFSLFNLLQPYRTFYWYIQNFGKCLNWVQTGLISDSASSFSTYSRNRMTIWRERTPQTDHIFKMFAIQIWIFFAAFNVERGKLSLLRRTSANVALQTYVMSLRVGAALAQHSAAAAAIGSSQAGYPEDAPLRADLLLSMRSLRGEVFEGLWFL